MDNVRFVGPRPPATYLLIPATFIRKQSYSAYLVEDDELHRKSEKSVHYTYTHTYHPTI